MPGTVKVRILAGRDLPVMDRASDTADAFVEVKFGQTTCKTDIYPKSLYPHWNSEWFRFEAEDQELQDEMLQIRVMDYDTYSANDSIGRVYIDLTPLLSKSGPAQVVGWLPIFDTLHGVRGEIYLIVKVDLFTDASKSKQSSCGIDFFATPSVPCGFQAAAIHGFVEELVANDDPEYQWIDKIRTPRASNEARQILFSKMSGEVMRRIGIKVREYGGNAVIGYRQCFDLEGESGIVVRGIGTAVCLVKDNFSPYSPAPELWHTPVPESAALESATNHEDVGPESLHRSSSSTGSCNSSLVRPSPNPPLTRQYTMVASTFMEHPFFTVCQVSEAVPIFLGGVVCARSVKLLEKIDQYDEPESRDSWWMELRMEIKQHMRTLNCNVVLGYREQTAIYENVCVLTAVGTAAFVEVPAMEKENSGANLNQSLDRTALEALVSETKEKSLKVDTNLANTFFTQASNISTAPVQSVCSYFHVPYSESQIPFPVRLIPCASCSNGKVPELLLTTVDPPSGLDLDEEPCLIQARLVRPKQDSASATLAKEISDMLPFVEHQLHSQLLARLRLSGRNAVFGLRLDLAIGEHHVVALATGSAVKLRALMPQPSLAEPESARPILSERLSLAQRRGRNLPNGVLCSEKGFAVFELDDTVDQGVLSGTNLPAQCVCYNVSTLPGKLQSKYQQLHVFFRVARQRVTSDFASRDLNALIEKILRGVLFKYRRRLPVCLANVYTALSFDDDEIQIGLSGMVLIARESVTMTLEDTIRMPPRKVTLPAGAGVRCKRVSGSSKHSSEDQLQDDSAPAESTLSSSYTESIAAVSFSRTIRSRRVSTSSQEASALQQARAPQAVFVTMLSEPEWPAQITGYLGQYDFLFIRETNALKEAGGLNLFLHSVLSDILYIMQAHVAALGGDAVVAFRFSTSDLLHNVNRNHAQCLIHVSGDIVTTTNAASS